MELTVGYCEIEGGGDWKRWRGIKGVRVPAGVGRHDGMGGVVPVVDWGADLGEGGKEM